jgi:NADPH2:quinone reductase
MRAVLCEAFGPPEQLVIRDLPEPEAGEGEVVIDVRACGINFPDLLMLEGKYQTRPPFPFSPGAEVAGVVSAVGPGVQAFRAGDEVLARVGSGGLRERVLAPVGRCFPKPAALDFPQAAGLLLNYGTALHALADRGQVREGERLVVLGAGGGVGLAVVEMGKVLGATVIAGASSQDKLDLARARGADQGFLYPPGPLNADAQRGLVEQVRALTDGRGADVLFDPVGGPLGEPALRAMAWRGRYLIVGFAAGAIQSLPANLILLKECDVRGVNYGGFSQNEPTAYAGQVATLLRWAADGVIAPHVGETFPLAQAAKAIRRLADRQARGKIIVTAP